MIEQFYADRIAELYKDIKALTAELEKKDEEISKYKELVTKLEGIVADYDNFYRSK